VSNTTRDTLAPWTYLSEEFFNLESSLFRQHWMLAGHISELRNAGDYITFDAIGERAIVIADDNGVLRGFHNVCRHRGARLLTDSGQCSHRINCPFHGWSYTLDGKLASLPLPDTFESLNKDEFSLRPVKVEQWHGLIFINFNESANPLNEQLQCVTAEVAPYRIADMEPVIDRYEQLRPYNWKVIHDIDNEGYHVPVGHPSLQQLYGKSYEDRIENGIPVSDATINDKQAQLWSVRHYQKLLPSIDHLPAHRQKSWWYIGLFPNAVLALYPDMVEYYMTVPVSVGTTRYIGRAFGLPNASREIKACRYLNLRINGITEQEDERFVVDMQLGMRSSVFPEPTLSSTEIGVKHFHNQIQQHFPVATLRHEPAPGTLVQVNASMNAY
jgi:phenylpropionate dioxygenase-like ring-hydroxylating dioxygenase large terminal subunit